MPLSLTLDDLNQLQQTPASALKKTGWRGVMRSVAQHGKVLVTNHNDPEAVILSTQEYSALVDALRAAQAQTPAALQALRRRFDERLAALDAADAGERLRTVMQQAPQLDGKLKAGSSY